MEKIKRTRFYLTAAEEDATRNGAYRSRRSEEYESASEWAMWWMYHLNQNESYVSYCEARRTKDIDVCNELRLKFPKIHSIYEDVGELVFHTMNPGAQWDDWFDAHADLFLPRAADVEIIEPDSSDLSTCPTHVVLKVPLGLSSKEAKKMFSKFSDEFYVKEKEHLREPKYRIHKANNRNLETIKRAVMAHIALTTTDGEQLNSPAEVAVILGMLSKPSNAHLLSRDEYFDLDDYSYFRGRIEVPLDPKNGAVVRTPKSTDALDQSKYIQRLARTYKHRIENTLHGLFPCDEPHTPD